MTGGYDDLLFRLERAAAEDLDRHYTLRDAKGTIVTLREQLNRMTQLYYHENDKNAVLKQEHERLSVEIERLKGKP